MFLVPSGCVQCAICAGMLVCHHGAMAGIPLAELLLRLDAINIEEVHVVALCTELRLVEFAKRFFCFAAIS